jgi:NADH dehydrogenase
MDLKGSAQMDVVTIFGASGFIGRYVVGEIAKTGARVRAAVRRPDNAGYLKPMGDVGQITPIAANIRDDASVAAAVDGVDAVINLVGILFPSRKQNFNALQSVGAQRLASAAKAAGAKRFLHMSAIGADSKADSVYASSKGIGEQLVQEAFPGASIIRPSIVFGPEDEFFNKFAGIARFSPILPLIGGGHTRFQPVYVGDVANAVAAVCASPRTAGATFKIVGPQVFSFKQLMQIMLAQIGRKRLLTTVPFPIAKLQAAVLEFSPIPILTRDQVRLLQKDNVASGDLPGLSDLDIDATSLETILPNYLRRYRRGVWHT